MSVSLLVVEIHYLFPFMQLEYPNGSGYFTVDPFKFTFITVFISYIPLLNVMQMF